MKIMDNPFYTFLLITYLQPDHNRSQNKRLY